ncbi:MAG: hypothetical protein QF437_05805, partial [Planctomycetota bacterium]|nr:hypothetical protein [Planctomycetota bacterium]
IPRWYTKDHGGNFDGHFFYVGINRTCENLALPFMQWASWKTLPWFKITEILPQMWNKTD